MNVFIAGGASSLVMGNLQRNLNAYGMRIIGHTSTMETSLPYKGIPIGTEGVIILRDMIGHDLSGKVSLDTKKSGLPLAIIERKWAKAKNILVKQGFIKGLSADGHLKTLDLTAVVNYIVGCKGRKPSFDELRVAYPNISNDVYQLALAKAAEKIAMNTDKTPAIAPPKPSDVADVIAMTLADDFAFINTDQALMKKVVATFPDLASAVTLDAVQKVIMDTKIAWRKDADARDKAIYKWVVGRYKQFQKDGTGWIGFADMYDTIRPIFGASVHWDVACKARAEVFGEWAFKVHATSKALESARLLHPALRTMTFPDMDAEIDAGRLKGFVIGKHNRRYTSEEAVVDYAKEHLGFDPNNANANKKIAATKTSPLPVVKEDIDATILDILGIVKPDPTPVVEVAAEPTPAPTPVAEVAVEPAPIVEATPAPDADITVTFAKPEGFDPVILADMVEHGVAMRVGKIITDLMDAHRKEIIALSDAFAADRKAFGETLDKMVALQSTLADEVKALREQRDAAKANPETVKATNLGLTIMQAKGAEVRLKIGEI